MSTKKRKKLHVGERVQTVLAVRAATHWILCLTVVFISIFLAHSFTHPSLGLVGNWRATLVLMGPPLVLSLCFLPWVVIDNLRLSNRFSGPIVKIRNELKKLRTGEELEAITLRKKDFFAEVAEEINAIVDERKLEDIAEPPSEFNDSDRVSRDPQLV